MLGAIGMATRGVGRGFIGGMTGSFLRSQAGARGYLSGFGVGAGTRAFMRTPTGIGMGAGIATGGLYGAMDRNTSVLGGMIGGGLLGAGIGRYGTPGALAANRAGGGAVTMTGHLGAMGRSFGGGVAGQARADWGAIKQGASLISNKASNAIQGLRGGVF